MFPLVNYGKVLRSSANELRQNPNASSKEEYVMCTDIDCFVVDSLCLHLTFVTFCLLPVIRKQ